MLDGIVPMGGYDATLMGRSLPVPGVFRGVMRGARGGSGLDGFDTFNVGLTFAPFSQARDDTTVITNVMTGRPARGVPNRVIAEVGPISPDAPAFPHAATALGPS